MTDDVATTEELAAAIDAGSSGPLVPASGRAAEGDGAITSEQPADDEALAPDPAEGGPRTVLGAAAAVLALASLLGPIAASGIWEPHELKVADLARRIAVTLFGAKQLLIQGGVNTVPTASELGKGELPFTSIAIGLRVFGLSEWAGRLPMALWGLVGVLATYLFLARLVDRVAAAFAVVVLATSPLYFLQARTILGDVVAMAGLATAVAGLTLATFDTRPSPAARLAWWLLGAGGMAAGFGTRGVLVGVAVPALSVGFARLFRPGSGQRDRLGGVFGSLCLVLGVASAAIGIRALLGAEDHQFVRLLGATVDRKRAATTHDAMVLQLGHGLFPWSAVVPFALGRMLRPPPGAEGDASEREGSARTVLLIVSILAFGAYSALAPAVGALPFGGVFALAAMTAILFRDFERGAPGSRVVALGVAAFLVLLYSDFKNFPEKGLSAFVVDDAKFPDSFREVGLHIVEYGTVASAALFALFFFERSREHRVFDRAEHRAWPRALRTVGDGNIFFGLVALEASLVALAAATIVSSRFKHWPAIETMTVPARAVARYGFVALPILVAAPNGVLVARDLCRIVLRGLRVTRASAAIAAIGALGAALSFGYYPLLARQISPKEVFDSFQRLSRPGEDFAMIGTGSGVGSARYYAHRDVRSFTNAQEAFSWLTEHEEQRRWLVVRATDIAQMNSQFRSHRAPATNLPVLDARSSEILLVSNLLRPGETNANPFAKWLPQSRPSFSRHVDADFNGQLHAVGWELTTPSGDPVSWVSSGKPYLLHLYYEVMRPISGEWQTFVHVDGYQRRYNGDHDTLEGKYPFHLWRVGDFVEDIHRIELEPNFTAGTYTVFFGLFRGDQRLEVKRGGVEDNRVDAGPLEVR
jgi:hypothetical protein